MSEVKVKRSKLAKILIAAAASILAAVIISFIILAFIPVYGLNRTEITDYDYVNLYDAANTNTPLVSIQTGKNGGLSDEQQAKTDLLNKGLKSTQYSAFRAAFEFNYTGHLRMETYTDTQTNRPVWDEDTGYQKKNKDGSLAFEDVKTVRHTEAKSGDIVPATTPDGEHFTLEFVYGAVRSIEVTDKDGNKVPVEYDTMRVSIYDSNNTISEFKLYFYDRSVLFADTPEAASATIPVILVNANTSTLFDCLVEIQELLN